MTPLTAEDLVEELERCVKDDTYFEIAPDNAETLLTYIRELESMAIDDRGVL